MPISTIKPEGASDRALRMLNGQSSGTTALWDASPGDYLLGQVRDVDTYRERFGGQDTTRLELLVEEGSEAGDPLGEDAHRILLCRHAELRRMVKKHQPRVGDTLCIGYLGRDDSRRPATHRFRYSLERAEGSDGSLDF